MNVEVDTVPTQLDPAGHGHCAFAKSGLSATGSPLSKAVQGRGVAATVVVDTDFRRGWGHMGRNVRWAVAGLATAAAFAVPAWLCGAIVLAPLLKDPAIRWSLASALGAVLGSLTVLWGHGFATRAPVTGTSGRSVQATAERGVAIGGDNQAPVSTGDTPVSAPPVPAQRAVGPHPTPPPPAPGTVSASGNRAIAIGGTNSGPLSTGDQPGREHP
ncbi:hypothetical protein [Streptomyces sp. NPDC002580]|uniref:hypothetical protein n=1 Tax=Streptomyces sp. NPDC002580 TaxID=3364653 RepID=UPI0036B3B817